MASTLEGPVLVTGAGGFVGPFVLDALAGRGLRAVATCAHEEEASLLRRRGIPARACDLTRRDDVESLVEGVGPSAVLHLAALSSVAQALRDPVTTHAVNHMGTVHLVHALEGRPGPPRFLFVSSAAVYGRVGPDQVPIGEDAPIRPVDPYAASKAAAEHAVLQVARGGGVGAVVARAFNHTGPGQSDAFVCSTFARQVAAIRRGDRAPSMRVGDLSVRRDFTDVRDVARAYVDLLYGGEVGGVYNVCSGVSRPIADLLADLLRLSGQDVDVQRDAARLRTVDLPDLRGDGGRFRERFGWQPPPLGDRALLDLLEHWDRVDGRG
ncbi:GDP-mannose 4,6-dehydratase [Myxococcota bacterium]|nr:GDP-mannose 4,6-dehydratase [Myxococcota bacterium]